MENRFLTAIILLGLCFDMVHLQGFAVGERDTSCEVINLQDCGYPGITEEECEDLGCCFDSERPIDCFFPDDARHRCTVFTEERKDCGYDGISAKECVDSRGCCFDDSSFDDTAPHCFLPNECFNDESTHFQCGPDGVHALDCINKFGCCFITATSKCVFSINDDKRCFLAREDREDCGFDGISRETCIEERGCCYDDSVGNEAPHCYKATSRECECTECGRTNPGETTCSDDSTDASGVTIAKDNEFPFLAQVEQEQGTSDFCAGVIIDCTHILTAEVCVGSHSMADIRVGSNVWGEGTLSRKAKVTIHPKRDGIARNDPYNIAILRLDHALEWSDSVQPICITDEDFDFEDERNLTEAGWKFKFKDETTLKGNCLRSKEVGGFHESDSNAHLNVILSGTRDSANLVSNIKGYEGNPLFGKDEDGKYTLYGLSTDAFGEAYRFETFINVGYVIENWNDLNDLVETILDQEEECEESGESGSGD